MRLAVGMAAGGLLAGVLAVSPALAEPLPNGVAAMIAKAIECKDPAVLAAVVSIAKQTNPQSAAEIDGLVAQAAGSVSLAAVGPSAAPDARSAGAPALASARISAAPEASVKGSVELGGALAQGANETVGGYGALDLSRNGPLWRHRLTLRGDFQQTNGRTTSERLSLAYEPRLQLSEANYAFGLAQYEHDRTLGYESRYTVGGGVGVKLSDRPDFKVAVDLGPAVRLTERYASGEERALAGRGSVNIRWLPTERITLSQEGAVYAERDQASAKSITALETLLYGPLKARISYNLQYERNAPLSRTALDTTTRASVLYSF